MTTTDTRQTVREAVGYFETADALQAAIDELLTSGFNRAELSLLAAEHAIKEKLGHTYTKVEQLEDDNGVPRTCYVSAESLGEAEGALVGAPLYVAATAATGAILLSGGTLAAAIAGAAAAGGAGALLGSVLAKLLGDRQAQYIEEQLEHGGLLLWVRTWDPDCEKRATDILARHSGRDVHIHQVAA